MILMHTCGTRGQLEGTEVFSEWPNVNKSHAGPWERDFVQILPDVRQTFPPSLGRRQWRASAC